MRSERIYVNPGHAQVMHEGGSQGYAICKQPQRWILTIIPGEVGLGTYTRIC